MNGPLLLSPKTFGFDSDQCIGSQVVTNIVRFQTKNPLTCDHTVSSRVSCTSGFYLGPIEASGKNLSHPRLLPPAFSPRVRCQTARSPLSHSINEIQACIHTLELLRCVLQSAQTGTYNVRYDTNVTTNDLPRDVLLSTISTVAKSHNRFSSTQYGSNNNSIRRECTFHSTLVQTWFKPFLWSKSLF